MKENYFPTKTKFWEVVAKGRWTLGHTNSGNLKLPEF